MMPKFTAELDIKVKGSQLFEVGSPLVYERDGQVIQVNPGFDFDGASIPKVFWGIIGSPMTGGYQRAACMHDALYASEYFPREICDVLFLEAMESDGVSWIKRNLMYNAVRAFGWTVWKGHDKVEVGEYKKYLTVVMKGA